MSSLKHNIYLFLLFDFLTNLSPISFIYVLFLTQKEVTLTNIGIIIAVYQLSKFIFEVPSGYFSDKYGRKKCAILGQILLIIFLSLTVITHSFYFFVCASFIRGISYAFLSGTADCLYVESILKICPDKLDHWLSIDKLIFYIAYGCSSLIGGLLALIDYDTVFYFNITIQFICLIFILLFKETNGKNDKQPLTFNAIKQEIFTSKDILYLIFLPAVIAIIMLPFEDYYPTILKDIGIQEVYAGVIISMNFIFGAIVGLKTNKINEKIGYFFTIKVIPYLLGIGFLLLSSFMNIPYLQILIYSIITIGSTINNISYNSCLQKKIDNQLRGTIISMRSLLIAIVAIIISPIVGFSSQHIGFSQTFFLCSIFCLCILFLMNHYLLQDHDLLEYKHKNIEHD